MIKVILNPDEEQRTLARQAVKDNNGYCPCKLLQNEDTKCMCKEFREQISKEELGDCSCGLYTIIEFRSEKE